MDNTLCACGCGEVIGPFDKKGRPHKFMPGHVARITKYKLIENYVPPENKICSICGDKKDINMFYHKTYTSKTTGEKYKRYRIECIFCTKNLSKQYKANNTELVNSKKKFLYQHDIKNRIQNRISAYRKNSCVPSDLTVDYLLDLYGQQDGYCYYTGRKMILGWLDGKCHHDTLSLDKLDPSKGYTKGNVVWCSFLSNTMKRNMTELQFYEIMEQILINRERATIFHIKK